MGKPWESDNQLLEYMLVVAAVQTVHDAVFCRKLLAYGKIHEFSGRWFFSPFA